MAIGIKLLPSKKQDTITPRQGGGIGITLISKKSPPTERDFRAFDRANLEAQRPALPALPIRPAPIQQLDFRAFDRRNLEEQEPVLQTLKQKPPEISFTQRLKEIFISMAAPAKEGEIMPSIGAFTLNVLKHGATLSAMPLTIPVRFGIGLALGIKEEITRKKQEPIQIPGLGIIEPYIPSEKTLKESLGSSAEVLLLAPGFKVAREILMPTKAITRTGQALKLAEELTKSAVITGGFGGAVAAQEGLSNKEIIEQALASATLGPAFAIGGRAIGQITPPRVERAGEFLKPRLGLTIEEIKPKEEKKVSGAIPEPKAPVIVSEVAQKGVVEAKIPRKPEIFYHGVRPDVDIEKIKREGLRIDTTFAPQGISLATDFNTALEYAGGDPNRVLTVRLKPGAQLTGDVRPTVDEARALPQDLEIIQPQKTIPPELQPLAQEARKYKNAEEFVNKLINDFPKQKNIFYRGEGTGTGKRQAILGLGTYITDDISKAGLFGKNVVRYELPENIKLADAFNTGIKKIIDTKNPSFITKKIKELGYDGIRGAEGGVNEIVLFNEKGIIRKNATEIEKSIAKLSNIFTTGKDPQNLFLKTKSQLTDFYNQAVKEVPIPKKSIEKDFDDLERDLLALFDKPEILDAETRELARRAEELREAEQSLLAETDLTFPDAEMEIQYKSFKKLAPKNKLLEFEDVGSLKKGKDLARRVEIDNILYSQEMTDNEILDLFKNRLEQEADVLQAQRETARLEKIRQTDARKFLSELQKDIKRKLALKIKREHILEIGRKQGALAQKRIEQRAARLQVAVQKRQGKLETKAALQEQKVDIISALRERQENIDTVRQDITNFAIQRLPLNERGKLLNMVRDAKTQRDLVSAYFRIETRAQQVELNQGIKDLKTRIDTLLDSSKIAVDYKNLIKDLVGNLELKGHTATTIQKLKNTKAFLQKELSAGKDVQMPQRILDKLEILNRVPKDQITIEMISKLTNELDLLEQLGETKLRVRENIYNNEKDLRADIIKKEAVNITGKEKVEGEIGEELQFSDKAKNALIDAYNLVREKNFQLMPMDGLAEVTGMTSLKDGLDGNFTNYAQHELRAAILDDRLALIKKYELIDRNMERAGVYALAQQKGGLEKLANLGITKEQVDKIKLTEGETAYYNFVRKIFDEWFPAVKEYMKNVYNQDVGQVENYVSFQTDFDAMSEIEIFERFGTLADTAIERFTKTVEKGFAETRKGAGKQKVKINLDDIFLRHTDDVAYMLTMGRDLKMYGEILNKADVKEAMGDVSSVMWRQWLDLMARKGGTEGAKRIAALDIIRRNIGVGVLGFRLSSAMIQVTALADGASIIGAKYTYKGATNIATSKEWRKFIFDNFPEIRNAVGDDPAFIELSDTWLGKVGEAGIWPLKKLDGLTRSSVASGAYEKLARKKGIAVDLANPDKTLIQEAQKIVRQSQGSSSFKDQPLVISKGTFTGNRSVDKLIFQFQSFMLNRWDNIKRQIWRQGLKEKNYAKAATGAFWLLGVATAMEMGIRKGVSEFIDLVTGNDDDEDEKDKILSNIFLNLAQHIPIMGSLVSSIVYNGNPVPAISTLEKAGKGISSVYVGKAFETKLKGAIRALGAGGAVVGVAGATQAADILLKVIGGQKEISKRKRATGKIRGVRSVKKVHSVSGITGVRKVRSVKKIRKVKQ